MKTIRHATASVIAGIALLSGAASAQSPSRTLIVLSETRLTQVILGYSNVHHFAGVDCTRDKLLDALIETGRTGTPTDILIATGPGSPNFLPLKGGGELTGDNVVVNLSGGSNRFVTVPGNIRTLITDARSRVGDRFTFNIRMVVITAGFGFTTQDDWMALGAKTVVGCPMANWTFHTAVGPFFNRFVLQDKPAHIAANQAIAEAERLPQHQTDEYRFVEQESNGLTKLEETRMEVSGARDLIHKDELFIPVNGSRSFIVEAKVKNNSSNIFAVEGQTYRVSCDLRAEWDSGVLKSKANGYAPQLFDGGRRITSANMMCMIARSGSYQNGIPAFRDLAIGFGGRFVAQRSAKLTFFANDDPNFYGDNKGSIRVTVTRLN